MAHLNREVGKQTMAHLNVEAIAALAERRQALIDQLKPNQKKHHEAARLHYR